VVPSTTSREARISPEDQEQVDERAEQLEGELEAGAAVRGGEEHDGGVADEHHE